MRLTNTIRDAFVRAVMNDVPKIDYEEQAHKLILSAAEMLFAEAFPGTDYKKLKDEGWLQNTWFSTPRGLRNFYVFAPDNCTQLNTPELSQKLAELGTAAIEQEKRCSELEQKLQSVAYSVTTREALAKALPEFEKYLPDTPGAVTKNLPAIANLVADFITAGWPKDRATA